MSTSEEFTPSTRVSDEVMERIEQLLAQAGQNDEHFTRLGRSFMSE